MGVFTRYVRQHFASPAIPLNSQSLVVATNKKMKTYHLGMPLDRRFCVLHKFDSGHFHGNVDTISFDVVSLDFLWPS